MVNLNKFKTFIFDLDGTIWNWRGLLPGVKETLEILRSKGKQILFVSNNSLASRKGLVVRLRSFGVEVKESELVNSTYVAAQYLKLKEASAFAIGHGVVQELKENGIKITDKNPDYLVLGQVLDLNSDKIVKAYEILKNGAKLLTVAMGKVFYVANKLYPATGVFVKSVEFISGKRAKLLGKPSEEMLETISIFVQSPRSETILFGDELPSDILTGKKLGYYTVLVRTGIDKEPSEEIKPDLVLDSVANLKNYIK